jgi:hypothetical protein
VVQLPLLRFKLPNGKQRICKFSAGEIGGDFSTVSYFPLLLSAYRLRNLYFRDVRKTVVKYTVTYSWDTFKN